MPLIGMRRTPFLSFIPKTVIVCLFPYYVGEYPERNVARYALINDYHKICGDILASLASQFKAAFPDEEFIPSIDASPIREVRAAYAAGLGAIGRHSMLIHEKYGSRVFIGTIGTGLELTQITEIKNSRDSSAISFLQPNATGGNNASYYFSDIFRYDKPRTKKTCLNCGKCISSCPTGAISADKPFDRKLCRSAITQKKSGLIDWEQAQIKAGGFVWGCDICADACPMNACAEKTKINAFYEDIVPVLTRENLTQAIVKKPYNWRGEKVLLRNISLLEESLNKFKLSF